MRIVSIIEGKKEKKIEKFLIRVNIFCERCFVLLSIHRNTEIFEIGPG